MLGEPGGAGVRAARPRGIRSICQRDPRKIFGFFLPGTGSATAKRILQLRISRPHATCAAYDQCTGKISHYHWLISDKPQKVSQSALTFYVWCVSFCPPPDKMSAGRKGGKIHVCKVGCLMMNAIALVVIVITLTKAVVLNDRF